MAKFRFLANFRFLTLQVIKFLEKLKVNLANIVGQDIKYF